MTGLLSGLRVVEGSAFVAAPSAGLTMAQMGADVIRFDPIGGGLDYRRWPIAASGQSLYWAGLNKGKRSVAVDLRSDEGRELIVRLITAPGDDAGVFLTNFPASGWMAYDALTARRPDLIMVNIKGNRDGGSEVDYTVNPATGFPDITGPKEAGTPVNHVLPAWDIATGLSAVNGVLAAERHRRRTGEGRFVSVALSDVAFATLGNLGFIGEQQINATPRQTTGNDLYGAFGRDFVTGDGRRVMIVAITLRQWRSLVETAGLADGVARIEAARGLDLNDEGDRYRASDDIAALLEPWCASMDMATLTQVLREGRVAFGPYQTVAQAVAEDWRCSTENPMFEEVEQPGIGRYLAPGSPLDVDGEDRAPVVPAPTVGQHTDEVLAEVLGMASGEIARLHDAGIVAGTE